MWKYTVFGVDRNDYGMFSYVTLSYPFACFIKEELQSSGFKTRIWDNNKNKFVG